jgi:hypothetical protein
LDKTHIPFDINRSNGRSLFFFWNHPDHPVIRIRTL